MGKAAGVRIGGFVEVFVLRVFVVGLDLLACLLRKCVSPWLGCGVVGLRDGLCWATRWCNASVYVGYHLGR